MQILMRVKQKLMVKKRCLDVVLMMRFLGPIVYVQCRAGPVVESSPGNKEPTMVPTVDGTLGESEA